MHWSKQVNPLTRLALLAVLVLGTLGALVAGVKTWEHHIDERGYQRGREETVAQWNQANATALRERSAERDRLQKQKDDAIHEANEREKSLRADVARVSAERNGLRGDLAASRAGIAGASVEALRRRVAALTDVFEQCTDRYSDVAEKADRHAADALMFDKAWPTQ